MVAESPDFRSSSFRAFPETVTFPFASKLKVSSFASTAPFTFSLIVKVLFAIHAHHLADNRVAAGLRRGLLAAIDIVARPSMHTATSSG